MARGVFRSRRRLLAGVLVLGAGLGVALVVGAVVPGRCCFVAASLGKSTDGGRTWTALPNSPSAADALAVDPSRPETVYAGQYGSVFKSTDGGRRWLDAYAGVTDVSALAIDPRRPGTVYAGGWSYVVGEPGVAKSTNGGRTWGVVTLRNEAISAIAIDPRHPATVYAAAGPNGVYKSVDGARTWRSANAGLGGEVLALAIDPQAPATVYAGTSRGVFRSTNGGRTWRGAGPSPAVYGLAIDPSTPEIAYVIPRRGLLKTVDRGRTWRVVRSLGRVDVAALTIDPRMPTTLYASAPGHGILRSTNGGASWRPFNKGLPTLRVGTLAIASTGRVLYAGTRGRGVVGYRFPG